MFRIKPSIINICLKPLLNRMSKNKKFSTSNGKLFTTLTEKQENIILTIYGGIIITSTLITPAIYAEEIISDVKNYKCNLAIEIICYSVLGIVQGIVLPFATPFLIPFGLFWLRVKYLKNNKIKNNIENNDLNNIVVEAIKKS